MIHRLLLLPVIVAVFFADSCAFAAATRASRSGGKSTSNDVPVNVSDDTVAPMTARAGARTVKPATQTSVQPGAVSARAAVRSAPSVAPATPSVAARAATYKKVLNMGTKVATATANTVVSQECQDAYFGCMDSFCMVENVKGGRCKCDDKIIEYDARFAEIQEQDKKSYIKQTEGVALVKMGKSADEVYAMAEEASKRLSNEPVVEEKPDVDLSPWNKNTWFEEDDEIFEEDELILDADLTSKTGDKLHATAASICTQQIPLQCKSATPMLRMIYVQKIQSDCAAYDNSLKEQQLESEQKSLLAEQSLREATLERYQSENKYNLSECVSEYTSCMQKDETCGNGFLGCVTFAAMDNMQNDSTGQVAETISTNVFLRSNKAAENFWSISRKESTKTGGVQLAKTTIEQLLSKRVYCDGILDQCQSVKDRVWESFLTAVAPKIATAESNAEAELRMNCTSEITECFHKACSEQTDANNQDGSYDMCLSNPNLFKSFCKPKLEPCLIATGGSYDEPEKSALWDGLSAWLASMKVGKCNQEVEACLLADDVCGKDFSNCIGLSTYQIGQLCPFEKLTACMSENKDGKKSQEQIESEVREYVAKIGKGFALRIDTDMADLCKNALKEVMYTHCGAEDTCPNATIDENIFKGVMRVELCDVSNKNDPDCKQDPYQFDKDKIIKGYVVPQLRNQVDITALKYNLKPLIKLNSTKVFSIDDASKTKLPNFDDISLKKVENALNLAFSNMINLIESDQKVKYCMTGRKVKGFDDNWIGTTSSSKNGAKGRFENLTEDVREIIAKQLLDSVSPIYADTYEQVLNDEYASVNQLLNVRINEIVQMTQEQQDMINQKVCNQLVTAFGSDYEPHFVIGCGTDKRTSTWGAYVDYDRSTSTCVVTKRSFGCTKPLTGCCWAWNKSVGEATIEAEKHFAMPTVSRSNIKDTKGGVTKIKKSDYID